MNRTDTQLGGGYTYQWGCAILLALNYFYEPVKYDATLYDLVTGFLGEVTEVHLEGKKQVQKVDPEGKEQKQVVDLEDIALVSGQRQILIQVKTKQADWGHWTLTEDLLLKALSHFYDSPLLNQESDDTRFVFLTNRPFNRDLVKIQRSIEAGTVGDCPEASKLLVYLGRDMQKSLDPERFHLMLSRAALVPYLALDAVKANIEAKLQAYGRRDWQQAYDSLFAHFARQSTRLGGAIVSRESIAEVLGPQVSREAMAVPVLFTAPSRHKGRFVGREVELAELHRLLQAGQGAIGISGMGGIGKTRLAVEYAHHYQDAYPGGVLWIDAKRVDQWNAKLVDLADRLGLKPADPSSPDRTGQMVAALSRQLHASPGTLVIFDNVAEPRHLQTVDLGAGIRPAELGGTLLFTTRWREMPKGLQSLDLRVLPRESSREMLLAARPGAASSPTLDRLCAVLGDLPLALKLAAAALENRPHLSLASYLEKLEALGADLLHEKAKVTLDDYYAASLTPALQAQWDMLASEDACLLLRVAGQLGEAELIPVARLGLLADLHDDEDGLDEPLSDALRELEAASLIEELVGGEIRLHPLVREFAAGRTPEEERPAFRVRCAANLADAFDQFAVLQDQCARRGIDALQGDLLTALDLLSSEPQDSSEDTRSSLQGILRLLQREAHNLRAWNPAQAPTFFAQQIHNRAAALGSAGIATEAATWLNQQRREYVSQQWCAASESSALERTLVGHERNVRAVAVTPDGRRAVSASEDWTLKVWDLASGEELATLRGHKGDVNAVAVTPDGRRAVSGSDDQTVRVWDLASGAEVAALRGHERWVLAVAVTADGRRAVSGSDDGTLKVWDLASAEAQGSGEAVATLRGHKYYKVNAVAVTPDGQRAVSACDDWTLKVWDLAMGEELATLRGHGGEVKAVAVTPDGRRAVSASDGMLKVWDLASGEELSTLRGHESRVRAVESTSDGRFGESVSLDGFELSVRAVAVTPDGRRAVSASDDRTLRVWDLAIGEQVSSLRGHERRVRAVAVTPDGRRVVSASDDWTLKVWDLASGEELATLPHAGEVNDVAVTPDGRRAVSASSDRTLNVWDIASPSLLAILPHGQEVRAVALTPDGRRAVSASRDGRPDATLKVWDLARAETLGRGEELATLRSHEYSVEAVAVTPDGRRAVSGSENGTLKVWDLASAEALGSGEAVATLRGHHGFVRAVAVTPDGRRAVSSAALENTLKVWDLASGEEVATLFEHEGDVSAVAVTPDGRRVVSASGDGTLKVWDLASAEEVSTLRGHVASVEAVALTPDGRRAVSASADRMVRVWDLETGEELATAALDGVLGCISVAPDGTTIVTGDNAGNVYCLRYVEPPVMG